MRVCVCVANIVPLEYACRRACVHVCTACTFIINACKRLS